MPRTRDMRIGVVGAGVMGRGIAQLLALSGFRLKLCDASTRSIAAAWQEIYARVGRMESEGKIRLGTFTEVKKRLVLSDLSFFSEVDFVIEAVAEDLAIKRRVFGELDRICPPHVMFASNTSSLPISSIASATKRPDRCIGMHFMNPPMLVPLLEIISGDRTSRSTLRRTRALARLLKRAPIILSKDFPGFVVNRTLMAAINEAARLVGEGVATAEDVDASIILGVGSSKGMPILKLADLIGLDVCLAIMRVLATAHGERYAPVEVLTGLVAAGNLGKKTGKGFFEYSGK